MKEQVLVTKIIKKEAQFLWNEWIAFRCWCLLLFNYTPVHVEIFFMNYSIVAYCTYLFFTFSVIIYVGLVCHQHGKVYSLQIFNGNKEISDRTNNILLLCYYLFNLGYCLLTLYTWPKIADLKACIEQVAHRAGTILYILGILHCINIFLIIFISYHQQDSSTSKQILWTIIW